MADTYHPLLTQTAYMMADLSDVDASELKALYNKLDVLSCKDYSHSPLKGLVCAPFTDGLNGQNSKNYDKDTILGF